MQLYLLFVVALTFFISTCYKRSSPPIPPTSITLWCRYRREGVHVHGSGAMGIGGGVEEEEPMGMTPVASRTMMRMMTRAPATTMTKTSLRFFWLQQLFFSS